jgi:mannose PTS system EIIA component
MNGIVIIAHAPLASALKACALHVFPDCDSSLVAIDVQPNAQPEETLSSARIALAQLGVDHALVLTDIFGATPCNVAQKLVDGVHTKLIAGVNLPMLLRTVTYRHESLDALFARAMAGGAQGVMQVAVTAPQNQSRRKHDQNHHDHQQ